MEAVVAESPEIANYVAKQEAQGSRKHLAWHLKTWLCGQHSLQRDLWNVAKRRRVQ
ncbi:hypothetical protein RFUL19S_04967 [Rhizobacter fulvus]